MIARARVKLAGRPVRFHLGDAENTMMPDEAYDAVVTRHLVWTLPDPDSAFQDWLRVLKLGGHLLIVDGDWVTKGPMARLLMMLSARIDRLTGSPPLWDEAAHERIMAQVHFRDGLTAPRLVKHLAKAGFTDVRAGALAGIRWPQARSATWSERLRIMAATRGATFIVAARKPACKPPRQP